MAEYYPLLAKAVAGLPTSTPEARRAVYERARKALLGQLQTLQPPLPETDVARETQALDKAVARLEAELAGPDRSAAGAAQIPEPQAALGTKAGSGTNDSKPAARAFSRGPAPRRANGATAATGAEQARNRVAYAKDGQAEARGRAGERNESAFDSEPAEPPRIRSELSRPEAVRPQAPQPESEDAPQRRRLWIVVAVVIIVVGTVAAAAWKLRDRPENLASFNPPAQSHADQGGGKIVERIGDSSSQEPSTKPAGPAASPAQTAAIPVQTATAVPAANSAQSAADSAPSVPIAYRAALLAESPDEQNKVKTYVGTVIWRLENVSNDTTQPPGTAVRADIDIPEDKLKASLEIQKNTDPSLSASHTMTVVFTIAPGSPTGGIKQISVPQLRNEDSPNGQPLQGSLVPIMDNSFLIGLNRGDAESVNMDLIKQREWFDIPILLTSGRVAKLTFEKNASGDRAIEEALASWRAQQ